MLDEVTDEIDITDVIELQLVDEQLLNQVDFYQRTLTADDDEVEEDAVIIIHLVDMDDDETEYLYLDIQQLVDMIWVDDVNTLVVIIRYIALILVAL